LLFVYDSGLFRSPTLLSLPAIPLPPIGTYMKNENEQIADTRDVLERQHTFLNSAFTMERNTNRTKANIKKRIRNLKK